MGFELATSMTVDKRFTMPRIHLVIGMCNVNCMYYSKNSELKLTLLLVNIIVKRKMST